MWKRLAAVFGAWQGMRVAKVLLGVIRNGRYWRTPKGRPGGLLYVAFGDSLAQGVGASSVERGYVWLVAQHLEKTTGQPVEIINLSKSGARLRDVLEQQLPQLSDLEADFVTVGIGGNDMLKYDRERWHAEVDRLSDRLRDGPAVVLDVPYFGHGHWERDAAEARQYLRDRCEAAGVAVTDGSRRFEEAGWKGMFTLYAADWFHFDDDGHALWAESVTDLIDRRGLDRLLRRESVAADS